MTTKTINAHKCIKIFYIINILRILHVSATMWPSSGKCLKKAGYMEKSQKFVNQCTEVKYCFNTVWIKIRIKICNTDTFCDIMYNECSRV